MYKELTPELREAFEHIRKFHKGVDQVSFTKDGTWLYVRSKAKRNRVPTFGKEIDVSVLERALDSLVCPFPATFKYTKK
jgi:hypothetical protein